MARLAEARKEKLAKPESKKWQSQKGKGDRGHRKFNRGQERQKWAEA